MIDLSDKTVVVTGTSGGIGAATRQRLTQAGATVIDIDRTDATYRFDVSDPQGWVALAEQIKGPMHGLVCCAGITRRDRIDVVSVADMTETFGVNVIGPLLGIQTLLPHMESGASIVLIGSLAAQTGHYPTAYTTSKWALRGLAHNASLALGERGIRVNTVHPGFIETPMTSSASAQFRTASIAETPLGRTGNPDEVASVIEFLLSDSAAYVAGAEISVDGGAAAHGGVKSISDALAAASQGIS